MKGRKHKASGGEAGVKEYEEDLRDKPKRYNESKVEDEAEERKHGGKVEHGKDCKCKKCSGGRVERKSGGMVHHESGKHMGHAKHIGMVKGEGVMHHAGRKPRMSGGRVGADSSPLSSAHKGEAPKGRPGVED